MARKVRYLVVHHNGVPGRTIDDIRRTHVVENGWKDIGYHHVYHDDAEGSEHAGRKASLQGAHTKNLNRVSKGYCLIGNGNVRDFSEAQYKNLIARLVVDCKLYGLDERAVIGHRETPKYGGAPTKKTCPGSKVNLDRLRARVALALAG